MCSTPSVVILLRAHPSYNKLTKTLVWQHDDMILDYKTIPGKLHRPFCFGRADVWGPNRYSFVESDRTHWWLTPVMYPLATSFYGHLAHLFAPGTMCDRESANGSSIRDAIFLVWEPVRLNVY